MIESTKWYLSVVAWGWRQSVSEEKRLGGGGSPYKIISVPNMKPPFVGVYVLFARERAKRLIGKLHNRSPAALETSLATVYYLN